MIRYCAKVPISTYNIMPLNTMNSTFGVEIEFCSSCASFYIRHFTIPKCAFSNLGKYTVNRLIEISYFIITSRKVSKASNLINTSCTYFI